MNDDQPAYEPDDGDLTEEQIKLIRDHVQKIHPEVSSLKSVCSSLFPSSDDKVETDQMQSQRIATDKRLEQHPARSKQSLEWDAAIMKDMKRMYEDEEYRLEIAKNLSWLTYIGPFFIV